MTVTDVAVAATKFLFGMCDRTIDSDVGTGDFLLVLGILHVVDIHAYDGPYHRACTGCAVEFMKSLYFKQQFELLQKFPFTPMIYVWTFRAAFHIVICFDSLH